jgi:translocation and assembly module TamA
LRPFRFAAAALAAIILAAVARPVRADEPKAQIQGVSDTRLRQEIERAVGTARNPPQSRFEARRRAASAAEDAVTVLRSEGYYEYTADADVGEGDKPQSVVRIQTGPRFVFAEPQISWVGDAPVPAAALAAESSIGLTLGAPGRAVDVLGAEGRVAAAVRKRGYADAVIQPRDVVVDHAARTVQATFRIDVGKRVLMDGLQLKDKGRSRRAWVASMTPWKPGSVYDPDAIAEFERRLRETNVYDSVNVALASQPDASGRRPVVVSLVDRPKSALELGANYSTTEGAGVNGRWILYNRFGFGDTLTFSGQVANILSRAQVEWALPNWGRALRTLKLSSAIYHDDTSAYVLNGGRVAAELQQKFGHDDFQTYGLSLDDSRDEEPQVDNGILTKRYRRLFTVTTSTSLSLDRSNDILNPSQGWRLQARAEPTVSTGDGPIAYVRTQIQGSVYVPFDSEGFTVAAGRVLVGSILGGNIPGVPASRRFYSGGGGSVRGYAYQDVGPRLPDGTPQGGLSLIETSLELRRQIFGPWGVVAFVDSGVLGSRQTFDLSTVETGIGVGVRYNLGFAPFRFDIAIPMEKRSGDAAFQVYLSIGQNF